MEKLRLDKYLSSQLAVSRNDAKKLLKEGRVTVDGATVTKGELQIVPENSEVMLSGRRITYKKYVYIMLNKPKGVVSASASTDEKTVVDILPEDMKRPGLFPAGRLDKDTTGFVLITDDGEFAHNILSPSKHIKKTYVVQLERDVTEEEKSLFEQGMDLGELILKPASLDKISSRTYEIAISEGRYHQIKRMFAKTGNRVTELKRIKMGELELDKNLAEGECREILPEELKLITLK